MSAEGHASTLDFQQDGIIESICLLLSKVAALSTMVMTVVEVISRRVFSFSLEVTDEMGGYLLVAMFFFSLSVCQSSNSFHRIGIVQNRISLRWQMISRLAFECMSLAACAILLWYLTRFELMSWNRGNVSFSLLAMPLWIPRAVMPLGISALCFAIIKSIIALAKSLVRDFRFSASGTHYDR